MVSCHFLCTGSPSRLFCQEFPIHTSRPNSALTSSVMPFPTSEAWLVTLLSTFAQHFVLGIARALILLKASVLADFEISLRSTVTSTDSVQ